MFSNYFNRCGQWRVYVDLNNELYLFRRLCSLWYHVVEYLGVQFENISQKH